MMGESSGRHIWKTKHHTGDSNNSIPNCPVRCQHNVVSIGSKGGVLLPFILTSGSSVFSLFCSGPGAILCIWLSSRSIFDVTPIQSKSHCSSCSRWNNAIYSPSIFHRKAIKLYITVSGWLCGCYLVMYTSSFYLQDEWILLFYYTKHGSRPCERRRDAWWQACTWKGRKC